MSDQGGTHAAASDGKGLVYATGCYTLWGVLPVYFHMLDRVGPLEIVAQRMLWSLFLILFLISLRSGLRAFADVLRSRRLMLPLMGSATLICSNWLLYIWSVNNGHVVATSLGYFLNPMINILLGVAFMKERLRRGQVIAIAVAAMGVAVLASGALNTLWISLGLALTFALYGLIRKVTPVQPIRGLGAETLILTPFGVAYLLWQHDHGGLTFGSDLGISLMLVTTGAVTAFPLLLFAMAAQRLPMVTLGLLQYISPTLLFLTSIFYFGERLNQAQLISFGLIWLGLALFTIDSLRAIRSVRPVTA